MKTRIFKLHCLLLLLVLVNITYGQGESYFFWTATDSINQVHGITTDPLGRIWYGSYDDSVGIKVMNPDGTPADTIYEVTIVGETHNVAMGCRGLNTDTDGNIIAAIGSQLFRINYQDGSGMAFRQFSSSLTKPGVDGEGNIYVGLVTGAAPIWILDSDFDSIGVVTDSMQVWSRAMEVTPDGLDLYVGSLWQMVVQHYHSDDGIFYDLVDSLPGPLDGYFSGHTTGLDFDPKGDLWVSDEGADAYFIYDIETLEYQKIEGYDDESAMNDPRGVAFSAGGDTVYVANFAGPVVQMWVKEMVYPAPLIFDDFEDGDTLNSIWGGGWARFDDASPATIIDWEVTNLEGYEDSDYSLYIKTKYAMWGGVFCLFKPDWSKESLAQFKGISFAVKGEPIPVMFRVREVKAESQRGWCYYKYNFVPTEEWKLYTVPWDSLVPQWGTPEDNPPPFSPLDLLALDFGPVSADTTVEIYVDNIQFWKTPPSGIVEERDSRHLPLNFTLYQNYPNPFNATTIIDFDLSENAVVTLKVFDITGRKVATIIDREKMNKNSYKVKFSPDNLPTGIYVYQMNANGNMLTKKMLYIK
jgi:hypothetical protein